MINIIDKSKCNGCHACYSICPVGCIEMLADSEGFLYPSVDKERCIDCSKCEAVCPVANNKCQNPDSLQTGYAAYAKDEKIRLESSSGGIFTLLAEAVIDIGGVVFGAAMTDDCKSVHHIAVENKETLKKLRGSKYLQSSVENTFKTVREYLENGRTVLYSGTPCQIGGLYSYLGKNYENLYTQDLICHGVPSQLIWDKYLQFKEVSSDASAKKVFFRNKADGWKNYSVLLEFENGNNYHGKFRDDLYMKGFLSNIYLRPSCYECSFKTANRQADITLADFWGIQDILPEMDDDKGTSFVWIHSEKGKKLFDKLTDSICFKPVDTDKALSRNTSAVKAAPLTQKREEFFDYIKRSGNIAAGIEKYTKAPLSKRIKQKLAKVKRLILK